VTTTSVPGSTTTAPASTTSPAPHPTPAQHPASGAGRRLPATGGPTGVLAVVGVALLALGVLLAAAARRRSTA
jgi:LPXTG-motif cell wall-anchored protein